MRFEFLKGPMMDDTGSKMLDIMAQPASEISKVIPYEILTWQQQQQVENQHEPILHSRSFCTALYGPPQRGKHPIYDLTL